jgi:hypothetical protein
VVVVLLGFWCLWSLFSWALLAFLFMFSWTLGVHGYAFLGSIGVLNHCFHGLY